MSDVSTISQPAPTPTTQTPGMQQSESNASVTQTNGATSPSPAETFEISVNGRSVKMTRQEMIDYASMGRAANDKFNEAKKLRQEFEQKTELAKKDFIAFLQDPALGLTKDQIRSRFEEWYNKEFIEPEAMSPEQRRHRELETELSRYKEQEKLMREEAAREEEAKLTNQQRHYLQNQIIEALEKSNLPKTKETVQKMAFYMRKNLLNGWDAPMDLIIRQVRDERLSTFKEEFKDVSPDQFIELAGEEFVNKLRQADLKRLREKRQIAPPTTGVRGGGTGPMGEERLTSSEVNRRLRDIRSGKI